MPTKEPTLHVTCSRAMLDQLQAANAALRASKGKGRIPAPDLQDLIVRVSTARQRYLQVLAAEAPAVVPSLALEP